MSEQNQWDNYLEKQDFGEGLTIRRLRFEGVHCWAWVYTSPKTGTEYGHAFAFNNADIADENRAKQRAIIAGVYTCVGMGMGANDPDSAPSVDSLSETWLSLV